MTVDKSEVQKKRSREDYETISLLGVGACSRVFLAKDIHLGKQVALKVIQKSRIDTRLRDGIFAERAALSSLRHPNIIQLYSSFRDKTHLYFAVEYCGGGDIAEQIRRCGSFPLSVVQFYAAELVSALESLREAGIVHRDIKPGNLLLDSDGHVKLSDFNSCRFLKPQTQQQQRICGDEFTFVGTLAYLAPEALLKGTDNDVDCGADLWSLGCVLYEMLVGITPFDHNQNIGEDSFQFSIPSYLSEDAADLIRQLLRLEISQRVGYKSISELRNHPFLSSIDFNTLADLEPPSFRTAEDVLRAKFPHTSVCMNHNPLPSASPVITTIEDLEFTPQIGEAFGGALEAACNTMLKQWEPEVIKEEDVSFSSEEESFGAAREALYSEISTTSRSCTPTPSQMHLSSSPYLSSSLFLSTYFLSKSSTLLFLKQKHAACEDEFCFCHSMSFDKMKKASSFSCHEGNKTKGLSGAFARLSLGFVAQSKFLQKIVLDETKSSQVNIASTLS